LLKEGKLIKTDQGYSLPDLKVCLPPDQEKLSERLLEHARNLGYGSFSAGFFAECTVGNTTNERSKNY
jgi:hypothetical protein